MSFIGSNEVGTLVQQAAARNAAKCVLELGGKSPQIVFEEVAVERAVPIIVHAIVQSAGQTCTVGIPLLAEGMIADRPLRQVNPVQPGAARCGAGLREGVWPSAGGFVSGVEFPVGEARTV